MNKSVMKFIKTVKRGFGKRSPEILLGIGIASGVTATVLAVKATPKALELLTEKRYEKYGDTLKEDDSYDDMPELKPVEVVKTTWKCYIPAAISGAASIACLLGSHSVHAKRNAALATAYKLSETALNEYREKVVEEIGEDKEKVIRDKVSQKHLDETPVSKNEVIITGTGKQLCYDGISGRYFESDIQTIRAAVNKINETMVYEMYAALNDFYNEIGLSNTDMGDELGWNLDDGLLEISYGAMVADDGRPCITLDYHIAPRYDFSTEEVKESKLKAFGTKVKSGLQKHGKNIAKGAVIGLGLVAAYAIGSRAGGSDDDSDVVADSDYVIDEAESTDDEASEN